MADEYGWTPDTCMALTFGQMRSIQDVMMMRKRQEAMAARNG